MNARHLPSLLLLSCCIVLLPAEAPSQVRKKTAEVQRPDATSGQPPGAVAGRRVSLSLGGGFGFPLAKEGIKQFWQGGPAASALLLIRAQNAWSVGVGVDGTLLKFRTTTFASTYPGVPVQERRVGYLGVSIALRYSPFQKYRLAPYIGATVGAAKYTAAWYYAIVNGVRRTYYEITGEARLAAGLNGGAEYALSRTVSVAAEVRLNYLFHDPNAGLGFIAVVGPRFTL